MQVNNPSLGDIFLYINKESANSFKDCLDILGINNNTVKPSQSTQNNIKKEIKP